MKRTLLALTFGSALALTTLLSGDGVSAQSAGSNGSCGPWCCPCPTACESAGTSCEVAAVETPAN